MIYTSSWFTRLPPGIHRIGVSRGTPRGQPAGYSIMRELAPGPWFNTVTAAEYHRRYMEQLGRLDAQGIVDKILRLAGGRDAALLCYESPDKPAAWCHRGQIAAYLQDKLQIEVFEYGLEAAGCGWRHPKLAAEYRR